MFSKETPPSDPAFFGSLIPDLISEDKFKEILARSGSQEIKDLVKTESASLVKDYGTFGFPWIIVRRGDGSTGSFFGTYHRSALVPVTESSNQEAIGLQTWLGGMLK
jgi:glutathione S-transferase kappa 1